MERFESMYTTRTQIGTVAAMFAFAVCASAAFADTVTQTGTMDFGVNNVFSIEFYTDANVLHGAEGVTFTNMDPSQTFCYSDGRSAGDGKSDTGVLCKTNMNQAWYLKMSVSTASDFNLANFKYYMGQPWNRTLNTQADGQLAQSPNWYPVPTAPLTIYTSGAADTSNLPDGTLATFSFAINPTGLVANRSYVIDITYTISTTA
jgi:hypothetical protein